MSWQTGLNEKEAMGRCGVYRPYIDHANVMQLATCVAREVDYYFVRNNQRSFLGGPWLPRSYACQHVESSWTGNAYHYGWEEDGFTVYHKTTLPGPLFIPDGKILRWRWAVDNGVPTAQSLPGGEPFRCAYTQDQPGRVLLLNNWGVTTLVVASRPISTLEWASHEHMTLTFDRKGVYVLIVPLLDKNDVPSDLDNWLALVDAPPIHCADTFRCDGPAMVIRQTVSGPDGVTPKVSPVPPVPGFSPLAKMPEGKPLLKGLNGHYTLTPGAVLEYSIPMDWSETKAAPTRPVEHRDLAPLPDELAYAGDVTWEPGSAMDQLLSLRIWAPLAECCPPAIWKKLQPQLTPPTAAALRNSLEIFKEPLSGLTWAKEAKLFEASGDVCYDADWYNGFELSGLWRATQCHDQAIAKAGRNLASEAKEERELLTNYFRVFHDWEVGAACTDARGVGWNLDCIHNGMEGLLAQAWLCREEGDHAGEAQARYLAAKTAAMVTAAEWLIDYQQEQGFVIGSGLGLNADGDNTALNLSFSMNGIYTARGASLQTAASKNPYALAGHFPQFCALQKRYGRVDRYREIVSLWEKHFAGRYEDWYQFYIEGNPYDQEKRTQAAVMYHLAPEVSFRLWTLDEDPDAVETRFHTPLNLAEQLLCRAAFKLSDVLE